jgi:hypothetical protein
MDISGSSFRDEIATMRISLGIVHDPQHILQRQLLARCDCGIADFGRKLIY